MKIDRIEIHHYRLPLNPPFKASWDPQPRASHTSTIVRVRAGDYEGVGSGDTMLGFAGHESLFVGQDPSNIERHVRMLDNLQFHYGRMWPACRPPPSSSSPTTRPTGRLTVAISFCPNQSCRMRPDTLHSLTL